MREIRSPLDGIWSPFAARAAQVAGPVNGIQLETGYYLLTEAGDYLVQEA